MIMEPRECSGVKLHLRETEGREKEEKKPCQKGYRKEREAGVVEGGSDVCSVAVYISQSNTCIYVTARYLKGTCHINPHAANVKNNRE